MLALTFATPRSGKPQLLVSAGRTRCRSAATGRVCVWDIAKASTLNDKNELVDQGARLRQWLIPGIAPVPGDRRRDSPCGFRRTARRRRHGVGRWKAPHPGVSPDANR